MSKSRKFDKDGFRDRGKTGHHDRNKNKAKAELKSKRDRNKPKEDDWTC